MRRLTTEHQEFVNEKGGWNRFNEFLLKTIMRPIHENWKEIDSNEGSDGDSKSDEINDLNILRLMVTPAYVFSCYLSTFKKRKKMSGCSCSETHTIHGNYSNEIEAHPCPANENFVPISNCRQHLECNDPIYTCIDLASLGHKLAVRTPEFSVEYLAITEQAKSLTVKLLDQCSSTKDVETLLEENSGSRKYFNFYNKGRYLSSGQDMKYPRLKLAMDLNHREFVGHMYCQQMLKTEWYCNRTWAGTSNLYKVGNESKLISKSIKFEFNDIFMISYF